MTAKFKRSAWIVSTALCATLIASSGAVAGSAWWHGVIDSVWNHGKDGGVSNWYSKAPAKGKARAVPTDTAKFAPGSLTTTVNFDADATVKALFFRDDAPVFTFNLNGNTLTINGTGIENNSATTKPVFNLSTKSKLVVGEQAILGQGSSDSANLLNDGIVEFTGDAKGGTAIVTNRSKGSKTLFKGKSSAGRMHITNKKGGRTVFSGRSTPGKATLINKASAKLLMIETTGPAGDRKITANDIVNDGDLDVASSRLTIANDLSLSDESLLIIDAKTGRINVQGKADLAGGIRVVGDTEVGKGSYILIEAGTRNGTFATQEFSGFIEGLNVNVVYNGNKVLVKVTDAEDERAQIATD